MNLLPACAMCNNAKAGQDHGHALLKPDEEDPEPLFWIHPDTGKIEPRDGLTDAERRRALETIRICNLQRPALCTKRIQMWGQVLKWLDTGLAGGWEDLLDPRTEYKLVLRQVLTLKGQAALAEQDRRTFLHP